MTRVLFLLAFAFVAAASAHEYKSGAIKIVHPWAAATPGGAKTGAAYLTIVNDGDKVLKLVKLSSPVAEKIEIHQMTMDKGIMRMRPLKEALEVASKSRVKLGHGDLHLMLEGLKTPLEEEDMVPLTLEFDDGSKVEVELYIEAVGATAGGHDH